MSPEESVYPLCHSAGGHRWSGERTWLSGDLSARKSWTSGPRTWSSRVTGLLPEEHRDVTRRRPHGMCVPVWVCGCVYVGTWVCAGVSMHVCMSLCECVQCVCENVWVGMSMCVWVYTGVCVYVSVPECECIGVCPSVSMWEHVCVCVCVNECVQVCVCVYMLVHLGVTI